jgi:Pup amidohydrolase
MVSRLSSSRIYNKIPRYERKRIFGTEAELGVVGGIGDLSFGFFLRNGARLYTDCYHIEYASPETADPVSAVAYARAGELLVSKKFPRKKFIRNNVAYLDQTSRRRLNIPEAVTQPQLFTNFVLGQDLDQDLDQIICDPMLNLITFGAHENYFTTFDRREKSLVKLLPFFVTRQIFAGAGWMRPDGFFEISQRSYFMEDEISINTTSKRPIINTKHEPHSNLSNWHRLHMLVGDANMCEVAEFLKLGTTGLVLDLAEDGTLPDLNYVRKVSTIPLSVHDIGSISQVHENWKVHGLKNGLMKATDVQRAYLSAAEMYRGRDQVTNDLLDKWSEVLDKLDDDPRKLYGVIDWVTKKNLLERKCEKDNLQWNDPKLLKMDLAYHNISREASLFYLLQKRGETERVVTDEFIERSTLEPPTNTRAYIRGKLIVSGKCLAADWKSLKFKRPGLSRDRTVGISDPFSFTPEYFENNPFHQFLELELGLSGKEKLALLARPLVNLWESEYKHNWKSFITEFNHETGLDYQKPNLDTISEMMAIKGVENVFISNLLVGEKIRSIHLPLRKVVLKYDIGELAGGTQLDVLKKVGKYQVLVKLPPDTDGKREKQKLNLRDLESLTSWETFFAENFKNSENKLDYLDDHFTNQDNNSGNYLRRMKVLEKDRKNLVENFKNNTGDELTAIVKGTIQWLVKKKS